MTGNSQASFGCKPIFGKGNSVLLAKKFELNCLRDKEMNVKASAVVDSIAEIDEGLFVLSSINSS